MRAHWLSGVSFAALLTCAGGGAQASFAPPVQWEGDGGFWVGETWTTGVPVSGQIVSLTGNGPQTVIFDDASAPIFASLTIDDPSSTDLGMQLVSPNSFGSSGGMTVGAAGIGQFTQTDGTTGFGLLTVGSHPGSVGTVNLTGGTMNDDAVIGDAGTGTYNNTGAIHSVSGNLILGNQSTGNGSYTLTGGGTLSVTGDAIVGAAGTGSYTQGLADQSDSNAGNNATIDGNLVLGDQLFSSGTATINTGSLGVAGSIIVGNLGLGAVNQTGGSVTGGSMVLGNSGSNVEPVDTYSLTGTGALTIYGNEIVGELGNGAFVQGGGTDYPTHMVFGTLTVGDGAAVVSDPNSPADGNGSGPGPATPNPRAGSFTLNSGSLQAGNLIVANQGIGSFTQNAGDVTVWNQLTIAAQATIQSPDGSGNLVGGPSQGIYSLAGGSLTTGGALIVGDAGNGVLNQTGGTLQVGYSPIGDPDMTVGNQAGSTGNYSLSGGGSATVNGNLIIGSSGASGGNPAAIGTVTIGTLGASGDPTNLNVTDTIVVGSGGTGGLTQYSGSVTAPNVSIGGGGGVDGGGIYPDGGTGTYTMAGGTLSTSLLEVGHAGTGTFTQTGGDVSATWTLWVGNAGGSNGTYNLSDGTLTTGGEQIGMFGTGAFNQSGGSNNSANAVWIGGGGGAYTMTGGTLIANSAVGNPDPGIIVGNNGPGLFTQTGGSVTSGVLGAQRGDVVIGAQAGSTGTYALSGDASLTVYGSVDLGLAAGATGTMTIGSGLDNPTVGIFSTGNNDGNLTVGDAGNGNLTVQSGNLIVTGVLGLGINGTGNVTQSGGNVAASYVDLSTPAGSGSSTYSLSGGLLHSLADLNVGGGGGPASFNQSGSSTANVDGTLRIGNASGTASYTLNGGALNVGGDSYVGFDVLSGSMTQGGGSHSVNGSLIVGDGPGSNGLYTLTGGTLTTGITGGNPLGDVIIGYNGTGELDNSGGVQTSSSIDGFTLGFFGSGTGTYKLTGTGSLNVANNENVGVFGTGVFVQGDGNGTTSNTVGGSLFISSGSGGPASSYTLSDGALQVTGDTVVGFASTGTFTQSGGSHTVGGNLTLGFFPGGNGTYTLSGGTLGVTGDAAIGSDGTGGAGAFNESGGAATIGGTMTIGTTGSATLTGGTLGARAIVNNNSLTLSNGSVTAPITNNASVTTASGGAVSITGAATNNGTWGVGAGSTLHQSGGFANNSGATLSVANSTATFDGGAAVNSAGATIHVTASSMVFAGGLTNNGAYISDPSTNTFSTLTIGSTGYINASAGDRYVITGSAGLVNNSTDTSHWNTMGATLEYAGTGSQTLGLNASNSDGLANIFDTSFGWNTLAIDSGAIVNLAGGSVSGDNAFYVDSLTGLTISGLDVTNIFGNGFDIFYLASADPALNDLTYNLADCGYLIPIGPVVPPINTSEPGTLTLLASALAGLEWLRRRRSGQH